MKKLALLLLLLSSILTAASPSERAAWARQMDVQKVKFDRWDLVLGYQASGTEKDTLKLSYLGANNEIAKMLNPATMPKHKTVWERTYYEAKMLGFKKIELTDLYKFKRVIEIKHRK